MAGRDRMTIEEVVREVLREEHGDVIRESVRAVARMGQSRSAAARGLVRGKAGSRAYRSLERRLKEPRPRRAGRAAGRQFPQASVRVSLLLTPSGGLWSIQPRSRCTIECVLSARSAFRRGIETSLYGGSGMRHPAWQGVLSRRAHDQGDAPWPPSSTSTCDGACSVCGDLDRRPGDRVRRCGSRVR
jgi:hypothetical protein